MNAAILAILITLGVACAALGVRDYIRWHRERPLTLIKLLAFNNQVEF